MADNTKERTELILSIVRSKMKSSQAFMQYQETERRYDGHTALYMREAHFIQAVDPESGSSMTQIAQQMNVTLGAVSQTAKRVESKGYIIRTKSKENHRQTIAFLTEKGKAFRAEHARYDRNLMEHYDQEFFHRFTDEQLQMLLDYELGTLALATKANSRN